MGRQRYLEFTEKTTEEERTINGENYKELQRVPLKRSAEYWAVNEWKNLPKPQERTTPKKNRSNNAWG